MLLLIIVILVTLFVFMVMWKSFDVALKISSGETIEAAKKAKGLGILSVILLLICILAIAALVYVKFSPTMQGAKAVDSLMAKMF